jgi:hypothetical protein
MDINEALARMEIQSVLWRYARGVDRADYDAMSSVYHPDAIDHHCNFTGLGGEYARSLIDRHKGNRAVGSMHITNMNIEMDGPDDARVESYFLSFRPHERDGRDHIFGITAGRYLDHFQRRDGDWKIAARQVVMDWTRDHIDGERWPEVDGRPIQGRPKEFADQSYAFFA